MKALSLTLAMLLVLCIAGTSFGRVHQLTPRSPFQKELRKVDIPEPPADAIQTPIDGKDRGPVRTIDETNSLWLIGTTYYDYFGYGAHNRFIARDTLGGLHVAWMDATTSGATSRMVAYDYRRPAPNMSWYQPPIQAFSTTPGQAGAAWSSIDVERNGKAVIAGHRPTNTTYPTVIGYDDAYQSGSFNEIQVAESTNPASGQVIWPTMVVDRQNRAHVFGRARDTSNTYNYERIWYTRTDSLTRPSPAPAAQPYSYAFNCNIPSYGSATSRISGKVAVLWPQTAIPDGYNNPAGWVIAGSGYVWTAFFVNNDVWVAQSTNYGQTWNFGDTLNDNITKFRTWDNSKYLSTFDTTYAAGDTLRYYVGSAMVYDNNDNLHIVFNCGGVVEDGATDTTVTHGPPVKRTYYGPILMYHWTDAPGLQDTFSIVADGWNWQNHTQTYRPSIDRMSLSIATNNELYCAYTHYNEYDTSSTGWNCGEVFVTHSNNNGLSWYYPTQITDSIPAAATPGNGHSYIWPSMPEVVDNDSLYIMYFDDREGGSVWIETNQGLSWTQNQVYVKSVARSSILSDSSLTYPDYPPLKRQDWYSKAPEARTSALPFAYNISAYPNPFNPTTTIQLSIPVAGRVAVKVYDVTGREVATLVDTKYQAGVQRIQWRPLSYASGIYFIRMTAGTTVKTEKVVFMK